MPASLFQRQETPLSPSETGKVGTKLRLLFVSDEGLIPVSYIRAINLFAEPLGNEFAYKRAGQVRTADVVDSELVVFQRCRSLRTLLLFYAARCAGRRVVYDIDDYLLDLPKESAAAFRPEELENIRLMVSCADLVTCSTVPLGDELRALNPNIEVIPNGVEPRGRPATSAGDPVRLFISNTDYFKLTSSRRAFFAALRDILKAHEPVQAVFVGQLCPEVAKLRNRFAGRVIVREGFTSDYNEYLRLVEALSPSIALVPLEASEFHSFKSNIKYLDFGAFGIPAIFSDVAPYRASIRHGDTGLLAPNTREGWLCAIERLVADADERKRMGMAALADVTKNFPKSKQIMQWNAVIKRLASAAPTSMRVDRGADAIMNKIASRPTCRRSLWRELARKLLRIVPPEVREGSTPHRHKPGWTRCGF
jgi:processive 1,2-diacylglycerol beta-glucosyltransferase